MLNFWMIALVVVICVVAIILTLNVSKQEEEKQKRYEEDGKSDLERSLEYEQKSLKSNLPSLVWIYVITTLLSLIALAIYIF